MNAWAIMEAESQMWDSFSVSSDASKGRMVTVVVFMTATQICYKSGSSSQLTEYGKSETDYTGLAL
ncbi:hypothetical protein D3C85_1903290 [compost metagenome]